MIIKTSVTDPIRIFEIETSENLGKIGITFCPGKKGASIFGFVWERDLWQDIQAIKADFDPAIIITLMEETELNKCDVSLYTLESAVTDQGIDWLNFPIRDLSSPDPPMEELFSRHGSRVINTITAGRNVLVHCLGGVGRSGLFAAMILIELGIGNQDAIEQVRESRPGAIETTAQERYVREYVSLLDRKN